MSNSVVEFYQEQALRRPDHRAFFSRPPDFAATLSWLEIWETAQTLAHHIQNNGIKTDERIGILSPSCAEWELTQLSIFLAGGVVVGLDPHDHISAYEYIIKTCAITKIFVYGETLFSKLSALIDRHQLTVERMDSQPMKNRPSDKNCALPESDKIATIIFTSGTNFEPKGIEYTHRQIALSVECILKAFPKIPQGCRTTCWLPLSNLFQRMINFCTVTSGGTIYFIEKPQDIMHHLKSTKPHVFIAVPRFYEKIHDGIQSKIARSPLFKILFALASISGRRRSAAIREKKSVGPILNFFWILSDLIVFKKIRGLFGQNILFAISGSAPLRKNVLEFFHMMNILILEAYGTSENIVPIASNRFNHFKFGSVGIPLIENSVFISDQKEILVKGPGLFKEYLGIPNNTFFDGEYYKTSDLGHFDEDGFLYIEGRKSEIFKTTTGKKIPVVEIDAAFKTIPYVDVALTLGENRKAPVVLITLDFQELAETLNIRIDELWDLDDGNFIIRALERISEDVLEKLTSIPEKMHPAGFLILTRKFIFENQEITSNLKIRRRHIEKALTPTLDQIYLEMDSSNQARFWFLNSQDLHMSLPSESKMPTSTMARFLRLIGLSMDIFKTVLSYRILSKSDSYLHRKLGQILRNHLGRLRGPLQKIGQMMSYIDGDLPEEFREEVGDLLRDSPPVNSFLIRSIVESELKKPIQSVFSEWSDSPLYTASIGQIHYARLISGEPVAVKVLLPQMDQMARSDIFLLQLCIPIIELTLKNPSVKSHFNELKDLLLKECDFLLEAENYEMFYDLFKNYPRMIIPKVYKELCTEKVLVTSYVEGINIEQFIKTADDDKRKKIAQTIWEFHCLGINRYAIFNADPHPGNYLICDDKVAFVDFGFCKGWDLRFIDLWKRQTLMGCRNDLEGFTQATQAMGFFKPKDPGYFKNLLSAYREVFFKPWSDDQPFKITHAYLKLHLQTMFKQIISPEDVRIPKEFLAATRLYWGLFAIMAQLDVELNYFRMMIPYLEEPTFGHHFSDKSQHFKKLFLTIEENFSQQSLERRPEPTMAMTNPEGVEDFDQGSKLELGLLHALGLEVFHRAWMNPGEGRILDLGCGSGQFTTLMARHRHCRHITAIDLSQPMLIKAQMNAKTKKLDTKTTFVLQDITDIKNIADNQFDVTTLCFTAHHLPDLATVKRVVSEMDRVTKPSGFVFIMDLVRLKTERTLLTYVDLFQSNYRKAGLVNLFIDGKNSLNASWTVKEFKTIVPVTGKRSWRQLSTPGLPVAQYLLGIPTEQKKLLVHRDLPWDASWNPVPLKLQRDWIMVRFLLFKLASAKNAG